MIVELERGLKLLGVTSELSDKSLIRLSLGFGKSNPGLCLQRPLASEWLCKAVDLALQKIINMLKYLSTYIEKPMNETK